MKILVYGAGAVGGYLGAKLVQSGHDVTLIVRRFTAETINASGLSLTEADQTVLTRPKAVASVAQAFGETETYDLIIMGMKSYDLAPALDIFVVDTLTLVRTDLLDHHLLGRLGRNTAQLLDVNDLIAPGCQHLSGLPVNLNHNLSIRIAKVLAHGRNHCLFEISEYRLLVDILVSSDIFNYSE